MKVLVIPDVHLKPHMLDQANKILKEGIAEKAVCLMDLPDDWNQQYNIALYEETYDKAIAFAKKHPESLWCYGNHDLSYLWGLIETGYSSLATSTVVRKLVKLNRTLPENNPIQYVQRIDNVLFCHGGITESFVKENVPSEYQSDVDRVIETINQMGSEQMWNDNSPIWYRPQYGHVPMFMEKDYLQVVGHTPLRGIDKYYNVISCDVFSTYQDGRPIGSQEFLLLDTITWQYEGIKKGIL